MGKKSLLFLALLLTSCTAKEVKPPSVPIPVHVGEVTEETVPVYLETIGHISAAQEVEVRPQVSGQLLESFVPQGHRVKKGDLLFTIDPRPYEAAVNKAKAMILRDQAEAEFAASRLQRYSELLNKGFVSPLNYDEYTRDSEAALAQVLVDVAALKIAEVDLEYTQIASPIDGVMGRRFIDPGNWVQGAENEVITEIRQIDPAQLNFSLPQKDFQEVQKIYGREDLTVDIMLPYESRRTFAGSVFFVNNTFDKDSGTILMKAHVPNEEELLWPGEFVRVRVLIGKNLHAKLVPISAIQIGQQGEYVFVVQSDQTVQRRMVRTGQRYDGKIEVVEGLLPGETVVTNGQINLRPGSLVAVVPQRNETG